MNFSKNYDDDDNIWMKYFIPFIYSVQPIET